VALTPQVPQDIIDIIRGLEQRIRELEKGAPIRNAQISGGQGLKITGGGGIDVDGSGFIFVRDPDGGTTAPFYAGFLARPTYDRPDGKAQPGVAMYRDDGTLAFALYDANPADGYQQYVGIYDRAGNIIVGDDTTSGQGLARPYLGFSLYPVRFGELLPTTSATFEQLFSGQGDKQHPNLSVRAWGATDSGTTGELRVMVNGVQLGATATLPALSFTTYDFAGPVAGTHLTTLSVSIEARRTSGTGNVRVGLVTGARGYQS